MIHLVLLKSFVKGDDFSHFHYNSKKGGGEISNFSVSDGEDKKCNSLTLKRKVSQNKGEEKFHLHPLKRD